MGGGKKGRVLIIEDEKKISDILKAYLEHDGYAAAVAPTGGEGLAAVKDSPDLIILDLMLPDMDGEDICRTIRKDNASIPILMLTAKAGEEDRITGLGIGADDYVVKPFSPREVVARVGALLRRAAKKKAFLSFNGGALRIDTDDAEVRLGDNPVPLTGTEFKILLALAQRPGQVLSREQLVNAVQGYDFEGYDRTVDAHIKNLRHKIDPDIKNPSLIRTVYGMGYKFIGAPDED